MKERKPFVLQRLYQRPSGIWWCEMTWPDGIVRSSSCHTRDQQAAQRWVHRYTSIMNAIQKTGGRP